MNIDLEIEMDSKLYFVEATIRKGDSPSYNYEGSAPEIDYMVVYNELGDDVTTNLNWKYVNEIEDRLHDYYNDNI
jgi:hypothetical protein